jgi:AraC-like DNA-binding protein
VVALLASVLDATWGPRGATEDGNRRQREISENTRAHLNRTFTGNQTLDDLATAVGTSVFHLCRVFRRHTGTSIHRYRTDLRLRRAIELLRGGDGDILAVAVAVGYSGHSHFTRAFHRAFGTTPSRLRRTVRAEFG